MVLAKKFILAKSFCGAPKDDNFKLVEEQLSDELNKGGNQNSYHLYLQQITVLISFKNVDLQII